MSHFGLECGVGTGILPNEELSQNPPMACGTQANFGVEHYRWLQAAAILNGADGDIKGSSWKDGLSGCEKHCKGNGYNYGFHDQAYGGSQSVYMMAFDLFLDKKSKYKNFKHNLAKSTIKAFKEIQDERLKILSELSFSIEDSKNEIKE